MTTQTALESRTLVCMFAGELSNFVSNLCANRAVCLVGQALEELGANCLSLGCVESQEQICGGVLSVLSRLRGLTPEDYGSESASL